MLEILLERHFWWFQRVLFRKIDEYGVDSTLERCVLPAWEPDYPIVIIDQFRLSPDLDLEVRIFLEKSKFVQNTLLSHNVRWEYYMIK